MVANLMKIKVDKSKASMYEKPINQTLLTFIIFFIFLGNLSTSNLASTNSIKLKEYSQTINGRQWWDIDNVKAKEIRNFQGELVGLHNEGLKVGIIEDIYN